MRSSNTGPKDPAAVLERAAKTQDFDRPIALCPVAVPHFVGDGEAYPIVREPVGALPPRQPRGARPPHRGARPGERAGGASDVHRAGFHVRAAHPGAVPAHHRRPDHAAPSPRTTGAPTPSSGSATRASTTRRTSARTSTGPSPRRAETVRTVRIAESRV
ncbi:SAM-dependent methyltransferase [Streptomyces sp. 13-12-16]|uniref:SAM-dependent methyltransferase n=1 Tax=Streptomyces sp. 13-12-16 TaxID=1570823 RepID=UPI00277D0C36|nr:SAM-dependent methyltransferase [Streptomyces sp. 13-12-16]